MARQPKTQQAIIEILQRSHLLTAPQLVETLEKQDAAVNKTTVYRAIEKLLEKGILCKQLIHGDVPSYELRSDHHDHFICEACQSCEKIPCVTITMPELAAQKKVDHHHTAIYGLCENCQ
ncbi:MAG: transcriptional repressor [Patescibacteria group bacterium]